MLAHCNPFYIDPIGYFICAAAAVHPAIHLAVFILCLIYLARVV